MSGKITMVRGLALATGMSVLAAAAVAQTTAQSPAVNQTPAPGEALTPTQSVLQELPSVADLADRLLPAVVEITIESGGGPAPRNRRARVPALGDPAVPQLQ